MVTPTNWRRSGRRITNDETVAVDALTGNRIWDVDRALGLPVVANETVYWLGNEIVALAASDGDQLGHLDDGVDGAFEFGTLAAAGDRLYVAARTEYESDQSAVFALEAR